MTDPTAQQAGTAEQAVQAQPAATAVQTEPGADLVLVPPAPVVTVAPQQASTVVPVDEATVARLGEQADAFVASLAGTDVHSPDFATKVGSVTSMGDREIRDAAGVSNRMLDRPVKAMEGGLFDSRSPISKTLVDLRQTVEDLDPARQDLLSPRKLLGVIPLGSKVRAYFDRYRSSQTHLNAIINALYHGQDELRQDNAAIEQEKVNLWATMGRLQQYALLAENVDARLERQIAEVEPADPDRARRLREDVLFYVRQKHQDLLTQLAVAVQGYLALDLVRKNNLELVKGVDRATTTTVSALRTAVMVAQALANQKLVLDQISALNSTTNTLIGSTASMLRQQSARVHEQASSAAVDVEVLRRAFADIYATMDAIDTYKLKALDSMATTVSTLKTEVGKAEGYLERARNTPAVDPTTPGRGELTLPSGG